MSDPQELLAEAFGLHQQGRLVEAGTMYRAILAETPDCAPAHHLLGLAEHQLGRNESALAAIKEAIARDGAEPNFHNNLGSVYRALKRPAEAAACYRHALALKPDFAEAHNNLGLALIDARQFAAARRAFEDALALKPDYPNALFNLGNVLAARGEHATAVDHYLHALRLAPQFLEAYNNLGAALGEMGRMQEAAECYRCVLRLEPGNAAAHNNLGNALAQRDELDAAIACYREALSLQPHYVEAQVNLGNALLEQGKPAEAEASYARAIALAPGNDAAHWNNGLALLIQGKLEAGWREWRRDTPSELRFAEKRWAGEDLRGKTIFIHAEQGFGDTIQFARYVPMVAARGGRVVLEAASELHRLFQSLDGAGELVAFGDQLPGFDVQCPLMSLPQIFGTVLETIPAATPYLAPDAEEAALWARRLARPGVRVGLVWAGRPEHKRDRHRSLRLADLAPLARVPGVSFFALQKGAALAQAETAPDGMALELLSPLIADFADTAAAIAALDLVISVDTSVAHLAGALGKPVWLLLPHACDWRWLQTRDDSPWYQSARLFRQTRAQGWAPVVERIADALDELVTGARRRTKSA